MKNYKLISKTRFNSCQATITRRQDENGRFIEVFYSYTCPQLANIDGRRCQFTFENSRKAGAITTSRTTSKQKTQYFGNWKNLPKYNLQEFEDYYFNTNIDGLY